MDTYHEAFRRSTSTEAGLATMETQISAGPALVMDRLGYERPHTSAAASRDARKETSVSLLPDKVLGSIEGHGNVRGASLARLNVPARASRQIFPTQYAHELCTSDIYLLEALNRIIHGPSLAISSLEE